MNIRDLKRKRLGRRGSRCSRGSLRHHRAGEKGKKSKTRKRSHHRPNLYDKCSMKPNKIRSPKEIKAKHQWPRGK